MKIVIAAASLPLFGAQVCAADFNRDIRPLLQKHCVECHGEKKQKGELRLDAKVHAFKGGHDGPAIVAGNVDASPLFQRITSTDDDERMPPEGEPLSAAQIALIKKWIEGGAVWPENDADKAATMDKRWQHWSVQAVKAASALAEPLGLKPELLSIDTFINASLSAKGFAMSPEADRRTLIRRLSFDLIGLPPAPERVERFVRDNDPQAYGKLVDELLASPHYGERWARHWLDIAHYADTHGFERDQLRPNAWHYRDYVIDSLNADKPYDRFIREQIAGDVFASDDAQSVIATGFLAAGPWDFVGNVETQSDMLKRAARAGDLDDMVTQLITSTMGITINCARCHDHKLDPITQQEYYSLWSVFAGVKRGEREVSAAESRRLGRMAGRTRWIRRDPRESSRGLGQPGSRKLARQCPDRRHSRCREFPRRAARPGARPERTGSGGPGLLCRAAEFWRGTGRTGRIDPRRLDAGQLRAACGHPRSRRPADGGRGHARLRTSRGCEAFSLCTRTNRTARRPAGADDRARTLRRRHPVAHAFRPHARHDEHLRPARRGGDFGNPLPSAKGARQRRRLCGPYPCGVW